MREDIEGLKDLFYRAHCGTSFSPEVRAAFNEAKSVDSKLSVYFRMLARAEIDKMDGPSRDAWESRYKADKDMEKLFRDARAINDKDTF